mmetsp:Transcript_11277/g.28848  ORF Transcript_11277/g.28848 Transcript_11277/m.28848 type:complete len:91 (+) Transcript_11277:533-805(+)
MCQRAMEQLEGVACAVKDGALVMFGTRPGFRACRCHFSVQQMAKSAEERRELAAEPEAQLRNELWQVAQVEAASTGIGSDVEEFSSNGLE